MSQNLSLTLAGCLVTPSLASVDFDNSTRTLLYLYKGKVINGNVSSLILETNPLESNNGSRREISVVSTERILANPRFHKYEHIPDQIQLYYQVHSKLSENVLVYRKTVQDETNLYSLLQTPQDLYCVNPVSGDYATYSDGYVKIYKNVNYWANSCRLEEIKLSNNVYSFGFAMLPQSETCQLPRILLFSREKLNYFEGEHLIMEIPIPFTEDCKVSTDFKLGILFMADSKKILALDINNKFETLFRIDLGFYLVKGMTIDVEKKLLFIGSKHFIHIFNYGYFETIDPLQQEQLQQFSKEFMMKGRSMDYQEQVKSYFRSLYNDSSLTAVPPSAPSTYKGGGYCEIIPQLIPYVNGQSVLPTSNTSQTAVSSSSIGGATSVSNGSSAPVVNYNNNSAQVQTTTQRVSNQQQQQDTDCCVIL
ncbi:predicted protein [Naegleria gruberi]|uniref:Predicted protein n=1 Tax=Naegleria gruberi TaxID=5762 RepID=D2VMR7_NAEGR|nr:uncharacterized protein NAEGRDRAFT_50837 [Naegleria gruberi]EFC41781.1 predicted protein [Naegleria gruberi]|eukprot:XP_002674525.1 predicted protein [Naegleria gruberi strain NEG-M]